MGELKSIDRVVVNAVGRTVRVEGRSLSPEQARLVAVELMQAADIAQGKNGDIQGFEYEVADSRELAILRMLIAEELGWGDIEQELSENYAARIIQVGKIWKQRKLRSVSLSK